MGLNTWGPAPHLKPRLNDGFITDLLQKGIISYCSSRPHFSEQKPILFPALELPQDHPYSVRSYQDNVAQSLYDCPGWEVWEPANGELAPPASSASCSLRLTVKGGRTAAAIT